MSWIYSTQIAMVSFKTNNCSSDHPAPHCHLPGTLRTPVSHCNNNYPLNQGHSHDRAPPSRCTAPRTNYPAPPHGCALHPRLDQPVTSSTHAMDDKKVVQSAPSATAGQQVRVKSALDGTGVVASISGARRRSGPQGLRSPAAKRPLSAPVALQGWLHKQGSEGLMLWKKRWFVLSEYCLFYYKGPEEEKLLGSILLPSYRVTLCKPEDKVNKKFAFKAEHANMRTYHFAADTRESMNQWVNALTLATLLQDPNPMRDEAPAQEIAGPAEGEHSARPSVSSISSILNQSADDSDSGFHGFQSRDDPSQSNNNSSPNSVNTASFPNLSASNSNHGIASSPDRGQDGAAPLMNGWMQPPAQFGQPSTSQQFVQNAQPMGLMQQHLRQHHVAQMASNVHAVQPMLRNFGQPVYANAPPKPRRLTDGTEYSTPSPDPEFRKSPVQPGARMTAKSPISDYDRGNVIYASRLAHQSTPPLRTDKSGLNYGYSQAQPAERRTPDTYGRSAKPRVSRGNADYEDVYGAPQLYQRPPGPVGYSKGPAPVPIPIPVYAQHQQQVCPVMPANAAAVMRPARTLPPPRPHSADFLEYEASRDPCTQGQSQAGVQGQPRRPQRPKSSMDVVGSSDLAPPGGDGYFYSEERYAAQMRQSSVYLHQTPQHHQQQRNQSLSRATTPSKSVARGEDASNSMALNEISCPNSARKSPREQSLYRQHPMATQSLQRYTEASTNEAMVRRSLRERSYDPSFHDPLSHSESGTVPRRAPRDHESNPATSSSRLTGTLGPQITQSYHGNHSSARRWTDQQFARSASARLPRTRHPSALDQPDDSEYESRTTGQSPRDGERRIQQREESMKRLLEWKQRMLQSPLTRKPSATANPSATAQSELSSYYRRQALLDLAAHEASITEARHSRRRDDSHRAHVRSKSSDGRRSVVANVSRYNSYSSDDEEPGDVRRKRARRPSHAGRSPRQIGDDNPATSLGHDYDCKGRNTILQTPPSVSFTPLSPGGIPPDAGYEEVSFPSDQDSASVSSNLTNQTLTVKTPKKPGILKTPSSYSRSNGNTESAGRLNTLAGYIPESWQAPKNVQWNSSDDKENWDAKIDESRVIKEFSYQYIKPEEIDNDAKPETESTNSVQSRIRSFESSLDEDSPVQELLSMQEPLKVAPSPAIEAHVSRVDSSRKSTSNIREFALGDIDHDNHIESNETRLSDGTKSVKDLLADFERKSQQVRRQENNRREEIAHRGVFSDTETLLYDTGSDLDQPDRSEEINVRRNKEKKRQMHDSAIERRNAMSPEVQPSLSQVDGLTDSQETIAATPEAFARLSVTESMVTHDNSGDELPKHEDPSPEEHYLPMSPRKAILDPNNDDLPDSMMQSLFDNLRHEESSYVEMSQNHTGHSLLAPDGKLDSGDYSVLEASHYEFVCVADNKVEPVYMEVSQLAGKEGKDTSKCLRRKDSSGNTQCMRLDLPDILTALKSDSSDADDESSKDLESIDAPRHPRFSLSDTFRPASYYLGASRTLIELHDSSDSELVSPPPIPTSPPPMEELDSDMQEGLEVKKCLPQVPVSRDAAELSPKSWRKPTGQVETPRSPSRFSDATISSTFRDSRASLESASGSDSLELRNPDEEARHRRLKRRPVSDEVCEVLDSLDELESLGSRFDGASIDLDQYLEELQARDAFNVDLYTKDLSYNSIYGFNENMLVADKLQKTTSQEIAKINLNASSLDQPFHYNSRTKTSSASSLPSMRVSDAPPSHQHSQSFTGDAHYENVVTFTPRCEEKPRDELQQKNRAQPSHSRDSSYSTASGGCTANSSNNCHQPSSAFSASMTSLMGCVVSGNHGNSRPSNQSPYNEQSRNHSRSASQDSTRYSLSPHHRSSSSQDSTQLARNSPAIGHGHASNVPEQEPDQTGAPYYYSDLQTGVSGFDAQVSRPTQTLIAHTSRLPQLNNQRGDSALNKRNDISRLVNPITRQMPRRIEVEDIDEARRIAAELRKNSRQFLMADNKSDLLDKRNIYESDTLRRVKCTEAHADLSLPDVSSVNIYPHGLRDKSGSQTHLDVPEQSVQPSHRRSRSLEGLLDDIGLQNLVEQRNRANRVPAPVGNDESGPSVTEGVVTEEPFEGEDPWEQDSLWRESLRRVSIRHARSLDNLDTPRGSEDSRTRPKITRGATYVNDSVARLASPDPTERPRVKRRVAEEDDDGTYEALTMDRAEGGFAWNTETQKHFLDEGNLPPARQAQRRSFELDREKLRQWDLLSSACLLQEQQRNSMAESLGRGLPTRVNHEDEGKSTTTEARGMTIIRENGRASGSGSIIGRDPLPPRAVSTSQLAAQNPLTQPPMVVTTLPHARANGRQQSDSPVVHHATTPQARNLANDSSESGRMASDVAPPSIMVNNESLSEGNQCLMVSPRNLRVVSPIDHRVSSPSDSERHIRSSSERNLASPISMREMNGDTGSLRQMQRVVQGRESTSDLLHKRTSTIPKQKSVTSEAGSRPGSTTGSSSRLVQVSAGELLGRTHEELVLLLIQLRRQSAAIYKAMETCHMEIEAQARLAELDAPRRLENLQKLEELKKHLMNLEKQYEKGKPLVNLVDNMVKLGSLYNRSGVNGSVSGSRHDLLQAQESARERLEFNQRVQEQRLLAEERRDWDRLSPDHGQLQAKVQQLYKLDRLLQEESGTLHSLQQDKEILEKALGGLKYKLQGSRSNPIETERYRKQQILLERELSRVRMLLAHNSKKLEETVAENARLEQDLVVLRQKLQASRRFGGNMARDPSGTTATLEAELRRVQQLVGDLQRQRQDLSIQVRQLTEKSHSLVQQIKPNDLCNVGQQLHHPKKRLPSSWLETDLDSGMTFDHGMASPSSSSSSMSPRNRQNGSPHQHIPSPQYKEPPAPPPSHGYSPTQIARQPQSNHQAIYIQAYSRPSDAAPHNHISTLSPQLREQIQQHQLKQQLLKDQMQGKASPVQGAIAPLYINTTDNRRINCNDPMKRIDSTNVINSPPEYIPPPPPPPADDVLMMNGGYGHHEDNKFPGLMHGREKPEIKTVRIVKRESERRQRDRGDRNGNIGIPLTNGLQAPGGAKRLTDEDFTSQQFEKTQLGRVVEETAIIHAQSTMQLSELDDVQFQRSMSLPRGFGGQRPQTGTTCGPVPPPPRSDSMNALRNMMARRHRVRFENQEASSDSTLSLYTDSPTSNSQLPLSSPNYSTSPSYSPSNQNYVSPYTRPSSNISPGIHAETVGSTSSARSASLSSLMSPCLMPSPVPVVLSAQERLGSLASINSLGESPQLSPVFKSEAAKQIIKEMTEKKTDGRRRPVPKEKRRHYTVSSSKPMLDLEDTFSKMGMGRARDDLDMERALRPRINAPDVVRSTLSHKELKYNESTIDQLLGTPNKIVIPERYIPEHTPELSAEEKKQRLKKADAIRKMLSETTVTTGEGDDDEVDQKKSNSLKKKVAEEKRQRDHILQLNQILAKQVMEKSKMVAARALATLPLNTQTSFEDDDLSPVTPLPLYQQRENFYS